MKSLYLLPLFALAALLVGIPPHDQAKAQYSYGYGHSYYVQPFYNIQNQAYINYYDGNYHYHQAGNYKGQWYPAGNYAWIDGAWHLQGYGYLYPVTPPAARAVDYTPDWQRKLLDIAANRDRVEGQLRRSAMDYQSYLAGLKALGLEGNFHWDGYGQTPIYPHAGQYTPHSGYVANNLNTGTFGYNGNTLYGYTYSSIKDVYGDTNMNTLYQQASRLTQNAQALAGQATTEFSGLVGQEGTNRARVAEILAKAQAAAQALRAADPQGHTHEETRSNSYKVGPAGAEIPQAQANVRDTPNPQPVDPDFARTGSKCVSCHSGAKKEGGFDITTYQSMALADKEKVWRRLLTTDKEKMMPRAPDGGPGTPLTAEEKRRFFTN